MMRLVRSGIVRTGGCDGCGAIGDTVTASPEEHEDMPVGGGQVRGGVGFGLVGYLPCSLWGRCRARLSEGSTELGSTGLGWTGIGKRAGLNWPLIGSDPRERSTTTTRVPARPPAVIVGV